MRYCWLTLVLFAVASIGCSGGSQMPQPGDTVAPRLVGELDWEPGTEGRLLVEMTATDRAGRSRRLGFGAAQGKNPIAQVEFCDSDGKAIKSIEAHLSHRC